MNPSSSTAPCHDYPIQPVTGRFPVSQDLWEDTNLPFSCVVTPLAAGSGDEGDGDDDAAAACPDVESLSSIPKCLHCGAPHASSDTHYRPSSRRSAAAGEHNYYDGGGADDDGGGGGGGGVLLCYLCGRISSTSFARQEERRASVEGSLLAKAAAGAVAMTVEESSRTGGGVGVIKAKKKKNKPLKKTTFELPLRLSTDPASSSSTRAGGGRGTATTAFQPVFSVPAIACPILWVVVLDDSNPSPLYWSTTSQLLLESLQSIPDHVHISLLLSSQRRCSSDDDTNNNGASTTSTSTVRSLGVFQLQCPVPHVKHYYSSSSNNNTTDERTEEETDDLLASTVLRSMTEACGHKPQLEAAFRSLAGYRPSSSSSVADETRMALGWTIELVLLALETYGHPAGQRASAGMDASERSSAAAAAAEFPLLSYAGGKITCLLGGSYPPADAAPTPSSKRRRRSSSTRRHENGGDNSNSSHTATSASVGAGGFGGRMSNPGERFVLDAAYLDDDGIVRSASSSSSSSDGENSSNANGDAEAGASAEGDKRYTKEEGQDLTPENLQEHFRPEFPEVISYFDELGRQCAQAALGVDLLCLVDNGGGIEDRGDAVGLALFGNIAHKSGAPGPLLFDISAGSNHTGRRPQQRKDELSPRTSSVVSRLRREFMSRTPWQPGRVFGAELRLRLPPGFCVDDSSIEKVADVDGPQLACMYADKGLLGPGSAVEESSNLWRMGTCDPATAVTVDLAIKNRNVRTKMFVDGFGDVSVKPVIQTCFAYTTIVQDPVGRGEYRTVRQMRIHSHPVPFARDAEAIYASVNTDALAVVLFHKLALASFQDGLSEAAIIAEDWLQSTLMSVYQSAEQYAETYKRNGAQKLNPEIPFYPGERLLDQNGESGEVDILLAQGHDRLRTIPLMTYLLMQCDAFRPGRGGLASSSRSLDVRYAALSQMMSMPPSILTRCIAPRIQLWSSAMDEKEPIIEVVEHSAEAVRVFIGEYGDANDLILLVDAPDQICAIDGQYFGVAKSSSSSLALLMSPALKRAIVEAADSYRTWPDIAYELSYDEASCGRVINLLTDVLMADVPSATGHENFRKWKCDMAEGVKEYVS